MNQLLSHPTALFTLLGILILLCAAVKIRHVHLTTVMLVQTALLSAITILLTQLHLFQMPQGGDVGIGTMIPLVLLAYCYGAVPALLAGFLCGVLSLLTNPYIYHPVQVLFDYPFPFMAMSIVVFFRRHLYLGLASAYLLNFLCHFASGVIFFAAFAPEGMSPVLYSAIYNGATILPEFIICCLILRILPLKRLVMAMKGSH